jgi:hypothetical protein
VIATYTSRCRSATDRLIVWLSEVCNCPYRKLEPVGNNEVKESSRANHSICSGPRLLGLPEDGHVSAAFQDLHSSFQRLYKEGRDLWVSGDASFIAVV